MYLHTREYYQRQLTVPNASGLSANGEPDKLEILADGVPRMFLQNALGNVLFNELDSYVTNGVLDSGAPQKWLNLVNGVEYTKSNVLKTWKGLTYSEGAFKTSILAYVTYYHWLIDNVSNTTNFGEVVGKSKGAENVDSTQKVVEIWNELVKMNQSYYNYQHANISYVNGVKFTDWFINSTSNYVSLVTFLQDNELDYPDSTCKLYEIKNQFGI